MFPINSIIREINELPADRLDEVYEFVHALNKKASTDSKNKILNYAGAFSDMSKEDYKDFAVQTKKMRKDFFNRANKI